MLLAYFEASQAQHFMASFCSAVASTRTIFGKISRPPNARMKSQKK
jgi:hypothetical protein